MQQITKRTLMTFCIVFTVGYFMHTEFIVDWVWNHEFSYPNIKAVLDFPRSLFIWYQNKYNLPDLVELPYQVVGIFWGLIYSLIAVIIVLGKSRKSINT